MVQSIQAHPDFQTISPIVMNILSSGIEKITPDSGQIIGAVTPQTVSTPSPAYTNVTVTYC